MNYTAFITILQNQIDSLDYRRQLELAVLICKEQFPNYKKFFDSQKWGNPYLLQDCINSCEFTATETIDKHSLKEFVAEIKAIIPDLDDFESKTASYALNAAASVYEMLEFIQDEDKIHIYNIVAYYIDTIDSQILEEEDLTDEELDIHPVVIDVRDFLLESSRKENAASE